jgi:peptidoglycan LD-endopeptidase CwlK
MSAGSNSSAAKPSNDLTKLAPKFRAAVEQAIADCAARGLDAFVYEAYRSQELQSIYYARGRTVKPPQKPVTNASTNLHSWHGYGLAVDVVHKKHFWEPPEGDAWFKKVAESFAKFGCSWGGDWTQRDLPHFQWGKCKPSPSDKARALIASDGMEAVWKEVAAD